MPLFELVGDTVLPKPGDREGGGARRGRKCVEATGCGEVIEPGATVLVLFAERL